MPSPGCFRWLLLHPRFLIQEVLLPYRAGWSSPGITCADGRGYSSGLRVWISSSIILEPELVVKEVWPDSNDNTRQQLASSAHVCLRRGVAFVNKQTWSVHAARAHGYRARHFRLAVGRQCQACGSVFADNKRLGRHLLAMQGCLEVVERLHAEDKLHDISHGAGPPQAPAYHGQYSTPAISRPKDPRCTLHVALLQDTVQTLDDGWSMILQHFLPVEEILRAVEDAWTESCTPGRQTMLEALRDRIVAASLQAQQRGFPGARHDGGLDPLIPCLPACASASTHRKVLAFGRPHAAWLSSIGAGTTVDKLCSSLDDFILHLRDYDAVWCSFPRPPVTAGQVLKPKPFSLRKGRQHMTWCKQILNVWASGVKLAYAGGICGLHFPGVSSEQLQPLAFWCLKAGAACSVEALPCALALFH